MHASEIDIAIQSLMKDGVVAIPTETVYGLAANAYSDVAISKIFELKQRPFYNPLIVHIASIDHISDVAMDIPDAAYHLASTYWPGPLTLILPKLPHISDIITAGKTTVAVRVPAHPITTSLLERLPFPLVAPSANPFGAISPTAAEHVRKYFSDKIDYILDGGTCSMGIESTIIGFDRDQPILYRHGTISLEEIESNIGKLKSITRDDHAPAAPGMMSRHYAPHTDMILVYDVKEAIHLYKHRRIALLLFTHDVAYPGVAHQVSLCTDGNMYEAARNLYDTLHHLDSLDIDIIIAQRAPDIGIGIAINDKLSRGTIR